MLYTLIFLSKCEYWQNVSTDQMRIQIAWHNYFFHSELQNNFSISFGTGNHSKAQFLDMITNMKSKTKETIARTRATFKYWEIMQPRSATHKAIISINIVIIRMLPTRVLWSRKLFNFKSISNINRYCWGGGNMSSLADPLIIKIQKFIGNTR